MNYVLILGAGSDVGIALAHHYAAKGFGIVAAGRNRATLEPVCSDLRIRYQVDVQFKVFDARDFQSHDTFVAGLPESTLLTICVFGFLGDQETAFHSWEESLRILESNYTGAVSILNRIALSYEGKGEGTIVGISSVAGDRGRQSNFIYGSAKAGFTAYLSGLRNRLAPKGIRVITVKPGFIATRMTAHLTLPKPLTATPAKVAIAIGKAVSGKRDVVYVLWMWRWIMLIIRSIPEGIFKKLKL